jgi:type 1 glutamine amidotransferase
MCLHPFDQKKLPCQDFLCLPCVWFRHWRVFNSNKGAARQEKAVVAPVRWDRGVQWSSQGLYDVKGQTAVENLGGLGRLGQMTDGFD